MHFTTSILHFPLNTMTHKENLCTAKRLLYEEVINNRNFSRQKNDSPAVECPKLRILNKHYVKICRSYVKPHQVENDSIGKYLIS